MKLYHNNNSVCSQKVRVTLAEKQLQWESVHLELAKGEQYEPDYLLLNPEGVVPTLVDDGLVLRESSVIAEYLDQLSAANPLAPTAPQALAAVHLWLIRTIDIHAAINSVTFATLMRQKQLQDSTPEEVRARIAKFPNPQIRSKRLDLYSNGVKSPYVAGALFTLLRMFEDMARNLEKSDWLTDGRYGLSDIALIAYVDRLDRLGLSGLWSERYPAIETWLRASQARPSYQTAIGSLIPPQLAQQTQQAGQAAWPEIKEIWKSM
uniref:glutathione S-transferase family protein n=1 Tax=Pararhizobium sp. IMCC3301 TaxID=3067904 RepID=UPI002741FD74|nr:glutathione S-transferase family protein [Pararhizobium sp. IMCC3301]